MLDERVAVGGAVRRTLARPELEHERALFAAVIRHGLALLAALCAASRSLTAATPAPATRPEALLASVD